MFQLTRWVHSIALAVLTGLAGCGAGDDEVLVVYCGRSQSLVAPVFGQFQEETGIRVDVKYGQTAQLAMTLQEEGDRSPADLFWAQDAAALGQLRRSGRLAELPGELLQRVPAAFRHPEGLWVGTSGRARVLAYAPDRVDTADLPSTVFELTDPRWRGRVGWAPPNGSFQAFVTAMRAIHGDSATRTWLTGMRANRARAYTANTPILEALAAGEIDLALTNHYYLLRLQEADPDYPVAQTFFEPGDVGNLLLVSGVGRLNTARRTEAADRFIRFLLETQTAQRFFSGRDFEYPVVEGVTPPEQLIGFEELQERVPAVSLDGLEDLDGTLALLREVGLL